MTNHSGGARRFGSAALGCSMVTAAVLLLDGSANAGIVPTVPLATTDQYSVLAGSTVTNTVTATVLGQSLGLSPGTSVTNFPPGQVTAPGVKNITNAAAVLAKVDLTAAYNNAAGRPTQANTNADLANLHLGAGVYAVHSRGAMSLTGPLVLDGAGNRNSVFIFPTNSSLITASSSTVSLINGAQECNVFWQVGSSATLGTGSVFRATVMADQSISVTTGVTVHGRALARTGAMTLDNDVFVAPSCDLTDSGSGVGTGTTGTGTGTGTDTGLTNGAPPTCGPPRTGGAPLRSGNTFPWVAVLFVTLLAGVATTDVIIKRRTHLDHAIAEGGHGGHGGHGAKH